MPTRFAALLAVAAMLVAACSGDGDEDEARSATATTTTAASTTSTTTTTTAPPADLSALSVTVTEIARVTDPTAFAVRAGDSNFYVTERSGQVKRLTTSPRVSVDPTPLLDLRDDVATSDALLDERGLLGLAFSPNGDHLYLAYTGRDDQQHVDRWVMGDGEEGRVDPASRKRILTVPDFAANHNGGMLAFGPDGFLYYSMGDGGGAGDPERSGQDPKDLLASILRIDPERGNPYAVPADNPFVDGGGAPEVYAYGLRNPWRFSFDRATGDLWIGDVGQQQEEEIDFVTPAQAPGANFGWSDVEGNQPFRAGGPPSQRYVAPILTYPRSGGRCSVTGGYVYRGTRIPNLAGAYLYADFCEGDVRALVQRDGKLVDERSLGVTVENLSSFGEDADGELYALSLSGSIYRIDPAR